MFYLTKEDRKIWTCSCREKGNFIIINDFRYGQTWKIWPFSFSLSLYSISNCGFPKNLKDDGKKVVLYISKFTIKKSYRVSQKLSLTALSTRYLEIDGIPLFAYLIDLFCFFMPFFFWFWVFFQFFYQASCSYLYSSFLFWENILLLINVQPR